MSRSFPSTPAILLTIVLLLLPVPLHAADTYVITASAGPGGKISPLGDVTVAKGSDQLFVIEAFQGYRIENVMVDQRSLGAIPLFTFNKVNTNHVISATFSPVFGSLQVHSRPGGAEVLIDNTFYGTTDPGGPVTFTRIAPGIHSIRMLLAGYQEYKTEAQVNEEQTTIVPTAILVPVPTTAPTTTIPTTTPTTTATTTIPTTTPTTTATTTISTTTPTTSATTTIPTTTPTTTATTTIPTTTPTTTATTPIPTTTPTTTATTPIPTTTPTTTATTTIPTTTPTTTATTTIPTTTPTTAIPTTEQTAVPNLTMPTIPENGAMHPATQGNLIVIIMLAAGALAALVLSRDLLRSERVHGVPPKRRLAAFALFAIPSIAMGVVLYWYLRYPGESGGGLNPELVVAAIPLFLYLVLSSIALMAGALISWPFRGTLKVHVVAGALASVIAFMGLIAGDPSRRFITALMLLSAVLSTLVARWQEGTSWGGLAGSAGDRDERSGPADVPVEPGTPSLNSKGMFPPELTEKYAVTDFVGSGGLARVYKAQNLQTGEEVALKIPLHSDEKTGKSFLKEIVGWEGLNHENIVRVSGMNILPIPYVEMEFIPKTLSDLPKPLLPRSAARICRDVARGLLFAHERGIIHRDIKPQNILVTYEGVPKITDWGMSKVMGVTGMPTITGFSLAYAAPEQLAPQTYGETDQRTDIYQLGCVLYELITGTVPFPGNDMVQVSAHILSETPRLPSTMNPDALPLDSIIMRCLEKSPDNRYQDVRDLIRDLDAYLLSAETGDRYNIFEE